MYVNKNSDKFIDTERKYSPKMISDLIFPNINVKNVGCFKDVGEIFFVQ